MHIFLKVWSIKWSFFSPFFCFISVLFAFLLTLPKSVLDEVQQCQKQTTGSGTSFGTLLEPIFKMCVLNIVLLPLLLICAYLLMCHYKSGMGFLAKRFFYLSLLFILYPGEYYVLARQINYKKKLHDAIFGFSLTSIDVTMWFLLICFVSI